MPRVSAWIRELLVGERYRTVRQNAKRIGQSLVRRPLGAAGLVIIAVFVGMALFAPLVAGDYPNYASGANVCVPNLPPGLQTVRLAPFGDTFISSASPQLTPGTSPELSLSRFSSGENWTLLSFGLGGRVCRHMTILGASLSLVVANVSGSDFPATVVARRASTGFLETTASWERLSPMALTGYRNVTLPSAPPSGAEMRIDLYEHVREWHAAGARGRFEIVLQMRLSVRDTGIAFASKEAGATVAPALTFTYDLPGFPLGTDRFGRSISALLLYGAQVSLIVGFTASLIAMVVGSGVGILAGYYGGGWDQALSRLTDFFLVIPWLPFVLVLVAVLGPGFVTIVIAIAIVSWPTTARVVRSKVLSVKTLAYVERARAIGAQDGHIMTRHVFPVVGPLIFANMILTVSTSIFTESFLAFFGLGDQARISWGTMIENAYSGASIFTGAYWYFLPPGICITALVLAFTMVSYVLEEILNPKLRTR